MAEKKYCGKFKFKPENKYSRDDGYLKCPESNWDIIIKTIEECRKNGKKVLAWI